MPEVAAARGTLQFQCVVEFTDSVLLARDGIAVLEVLSGLSRIERKDVQPWRLEDWDDDWDIDSFEGGVPPKRRRPEVAILSLSFNSPLEIFGTVLNASTEQVSFVVACLSATAKWLVEVRKAQLEIKKLTREIAEQDRLESDRKKREKAENDFIVTESYLRECLARDLSSAGIDVGWKDGVLLRQVADQASRLKDTRIASLRARIIK